MHTALNDLYLEHLWVLYPRSQWHTLHPKITAAPILLLSHKQIVWYWLSGIYKMNGTIGEFDN